MIKILELTQNVLGDAQRLFDESLGKGYVDVLHYFDDESAFLHGAFIKDELLVGCRITLIDGKTGILKSNVVTHKFRGQGIGSALVEFALEFLKSKNITTALSYSWINDKNTSKGILERHGFCTEQIIKNYWHDSSLSKGHSCPTCGLPPCTCSAILYKKML